MMSQTPTATKSDFDVVIGLEVHAQLATETKIFCGCPIRFGAAPNSQVCPVCAGLPGTLPVLNRRVFEMGLRAVVALNGEVTPKVKFDRKNYFYPDLPKSYQISQYDMPVGRGGYVEIPTHKGTKKIKLTRVHLEEDAGKLIHDTEKHLSLIDLNRSGTPLIEIVSEPEIESPDEAYAYLTHLKAILKSIGVSNADMEKGQLRCDANISLRKSDQDPFGTKVEIKNLNSFKYVRSALQYEITRQSDRLHGQSRIVQETRMWDEGSGRTIPMRSKEEAHDYRYFPDPDLVPFEVDLEIIRHIRKTMPELPKDKKARLQDQFGLSDYDVGILMQDSGLLELFESLAVSYSNYKNLMNWILGPLSAYLNENYLNSTDLKFSRESFIELLQIVDEGVISYKVAKEKVFLEFIRTGDKPKQIVQRLGLSQISDQGALDGVIANVLKSNEKSVKDFVSGKEPALMFLVGQVMRETKGKANPNKVNEMIRERLSK